MWHWFNSQTAKGGIQSRPPIIGVLSSTPIVFYYPLRPTSTLISGKIINSAIGKQLSIDFSANIDTCISQEENLCSKLVVSTYYIFEELQSPVFTQLAELALKNWRRKCEEAQSQQQSRQGGQPWKSLIKMRKVKIRKLPQG